jgi:quercetin dioxygenase-like cupin family protein
MTSTHTKAQRQAHADPVAVDSKHYKVEMEND